jgi:hypothetical protein
MVCEYCGQAFWGNPVSRQRFHSASCRTLAWKTRRAAAAVALSQALGISLEKSQDVVETAGMRELKRILLGLGLVYDGSTRQWGMLMDQYALIKQESYP